MKLRYTSDQRLWEYPSDATRRAIVELLDLQFHQYWYRQSVV